MSTIHEEENADRGGENDRASAHRIRFRSRASELLERLLAANVERVDDVAEALMTTVQTIERHRTEELPMPIERQLLLAAYAIEHEPTCTRLAHLLRGQIRAAIMFASSETTTHRGPPPMRHW